MGETDRIKRFLPVWVFDNVIRILMTAFKKLICLIVAEMNQK